jgi:hypothetical protein
MKGSIILFLLLVTVVYFLFVPPSNVLEEYTPTPDPSYSDTTTVVTPDELSLVIQATQKALSQQLGKCTHCIETTQISLSNNVFTGRFMFVVLPGESGTPYGVGVSSTVGTDWSVKNVTLQSDSTIDQIDSYEQFKAGSEIQKSVLPTSAQLQSALNNI